MSNTRSPQEAQNGPQWYEIQLKGHLDNRWSSWFWDAVIRLEEDGNTLLTCRVVDQAALHGLLKKVRDLGMPLISVSPVEPGPTTTPGTGHADQPDVKK
jgi:hypothetical protein